MPVSTLTLASLGEYVDMVNAEVEARPGRTLVNGIRRFPVAEEEENSLIIEQDVIGTAMSNLSALSSYTNNIQAITMDRINTASAADPVITSLVNLVQNGCPEEKSVWPTELQSFHKYREDLTTLDSMVLYKGRTVIPANMQSEVLEILHSGHQGVSSMNAIATQSVFWPGMCEAISSVRQACSSCDKVAPSQPASPPWPLPKPNFPFEMICTDYFSFAGKEYYIIVDRYSGWLSVYKANNDGAKDFVRTLKEYFSTFGIALQVTSDGGPQFTSKITQSFFKDWGVTHRVSSTYFPHSNQHAEQGVKSAKRMLRDNICTDGSLNTDKFLRALLLHRNTPDRDTGLSPAQIIFGRSIRDFSLSRQVI